MLQPTEQRCIDRFLKRIVVDPKTGCWVPTTRQPTVGYVLMGIGGGRVRRAHAVMYEHFVGLIPDGMHIDHLCRNKPCCNPEHLEPVTPRENIIRGAIGDIRRLDICRRGHSLKDAYVAVNGVRRCRSCRREDRAKWQH